MTRILSVGQCHFDHSSLTRFLTGHFPVEIVPVATSDEAIASLRKSPASLVLVNRQFDADGTEGLDFIKSLKGTPDLAQIPVMLITNFPEYAAEAVACGAVPGFGKAELGASNLVDRLRPYLSAP